MRTAQKTLIVCLLAVPLYAASQVPPPPPPPPPASGQGHITRADSLLSAGSVALATEEYRTMYNQNKNDNRTVYNYACALSLAGQTDSALYYLNRLIVLEPSVSILTEPDFLAVRDSKGWQDFEIDLIIALNEKNGNLIKDTAYASKLWRLLCLDQYGFYETGIAVRNLGPRSPVVTALRRMQSMQNEKNLEELEILLEIKGWPEKSQVGREASEAPFYVLQHSNALAQEKYIRLFEAVCRKGEGNWQQYALMFDRMRMNQNLLQKYGTHFILDNRATGVRKLYPLEDETRVNEWRKEIGLEPLKDYMKRTGIVK
ncbi:MAG: DUF6624 domain-containing protein [Bacteroidales bacterium]